MLSKFLFGLLILFTGLTTVLTISKVINEKKENIIAVPTIVEILPTVLPTVKLFPTNKIVPTNKLIPTIVSISNNQCIIVVSGQQYNVTSLRNSHSGGDIFQCGADMTNVYQRQHGSGLSLIQRYLISGTTNSVLPTAVLQNKNREREEDDD